MNGRCGRAKEEKPCRRYHTQIWRVALQPLQGPRRCQMEARPPARCDQKATDPLASPQLWEAGLQCPRLFQPSDAALLVVRPALLTSYSATAVGLSRNNACPHMENVASMGWPAHRDYPICLGLSLAFTLSALYSGWGRE